MEGYKAKDKNEIRTNICAIIICIRLLGQCHFILTRLPATSCQYTNKYSVPAVAHTLKSGDLALSKKKTFYRGGGAGVFQSS